MKKLLFLVAAAVAGVSVFAEQTDHWTYNGETITDGEWTFAAAVKANTTDLTVNAHSGNPSVASELDFSKPVKDSDGTAYTIVTLNPRFNVDAAGKLISKLTLPTEGLKTISDYAFNDCPALTEIVNYVPDSVTYIGDSAFRSVPAKQCAYLRGITGAVPHEAIARSGITELVLGPGVTGFGISAFINCYSLTNVVFLPRESATLEIKSGNVFVNCTALQGTLDLTGAKTVNADSTFSGTKISKVKFGSGLVTLGSRVFNGMTKLAEIEFAGNPPTSMPATGPFGGLATSQIVATFIPKDCADGWKAYAEGGVINSESSTWRSDLAGGAMANRFLVYPGDAPPGELGEWVYDSASGRVSDKVWTFAARKILSRLMVDGFVSGPAEVSKLDFNRSCTDENGVPLTISHLSPNFYGNSSAKALVGELVLPTSGLVAIGEGAFGACGNLKRISALPDSLTTIGAHAFRELFAIEEFDGQLVPDSVTSIGDYAFYRLPLRRDVVINSVEQLGCGVFEYGSSYRVGITSVRLGPAFRKFSGYSTFCNNVCLTNITFDPACKDVVLNNNNNFAGATSVRVPIDLSCVKELSSGSAVSMANVPELTFSSNLTKLTSGALSGLSSLTNVIFTGAPPETFGMPYLSGLSANKRIATSIFAKHKKSWQPYADKGVIQSKRTTWAEEFLPDGVPLANRPLVGVDVVDGLMLLIR